VLGEKGEHFTKLADRINGWERSIKEDFKISNSPTIFGGIAAIAAFLLFWLVIWQVSNHLSGNVYGLGADTHKKIGTFGVNLHFGWIGFALGLIAAGIVLVLTSRAKISIKRREEAKAETQNAAATNNSTGSSRTTTDTQELPRVSDERQPATAS